MISATQDDAVTLFYRANGSDKVYHAAIESAGTGFVVTFAYGRRGSTLQTGTKTPAPVGEVAARSIFQKLVAEKVSKGYTVGESGTPYQQSPEEERATGILPQLLNPIEDNELQRFIDDDAWWMQEKFDGKRVLIRKANGVVTGINRSGLTIGLPQCVAAAALAIQAARFILDGEAVGDVFHAFDVLERDGRDLRSRAYGLRHAAVLDLVDPLRTDAIRYAPVAVGARQKLSLLEKLRQERREGAVFKKKDAPYTPGRPASGGDQLKHKFYATASCIVAGMSGSKRSVMLDALGASGRKVAIGRVTIPPNHAIPAAGSIVEVRYLYAFPEGRLYQPVYLGERDDIGAGACRREQLKYKTESADLC